MFSHIGHCVLKTSVCPCAVLDDWIFISMPESPLDDYCFGKVSNVYHNIIIPIYISIPINT